MKKIDPKKVLEAWKPILDGTPLAEGLPDGERLPEGMLPISVRVANLMQGQELFAASEKEAVPVTYKGIIVGACIRGNVEFFDTKHAKEAIAYIGKMDGPVGISSRKMGTINPDGSITEGKPIEDAIIITPKDGETTATEGEHDVHGGSEGP